MGFNFPSSPSIGQLHPTPAVVGIPQYQWNGSEWVTPAYNPLNYVLKSGDTMLGALNVVTPPTAAAHAASKSYVDTYAAPLDAMSYSGMQINGSMDVSQENGNSVATTVSGKYIVDGWFGYWTGTMALSGSQQIQPTWFPNIPRCLQIVTTTAQPSLGANDVAVLYQPIEGYRVSRLGWGTANAKPLTIGFWTMHHRTGLYSGSVRNPSITRSCVFSYTHNVADAPQYNVVTIPGCTDGTWAIDNAVGMYVTFTMASGTTQVAPATNTWYNVNYVAAPGQVNGVAAAPSDVFRITGVVVLPGIYAPTAAQSPLIMRTFDQELMTCLRYWQSSYPYGVAPGTATQLGMVGNISGAVGHFVLGTRYAKKRSTPTVTIYSPVTGAAGVISDSFASDKAAVADAAGDEGCRVFATVTLTANSSSYFQYVANARL